MNKVIAINKPVGITSYDVIRQLKKQYPGEIIGHAGTLDPLADGILICLIGKQATKRQSEFMDVTKEYVFTVLFGVGTDTYDILGLINETTPYLTSQIDVKINANLDKFKGKIMQQVPPFSAVKIKGKPLYRWYLDGKISEIEIPIKEIDVMELEYIEKKLVSKDALKDEIIDLIEKVKSGFRQKSVLEGWNDFFTKTNQEEFLVGKFKAVVSKGTYVRSIAEALGKSIQVPACTLTITRTKVGEFNL